MRISPKKFEKLPGRNNLDSAKGSARHGSPSDLALTGSNSIKQALRVGFGFQSESLGRFTTPLVQTLPAAGREVLLPSPEGFQGRQSEYLLDMP